MHKCILTAWTNSSARRQSRPSVHDIYIYIYIYIYTHTHTQKHTYIHAYKHTVWTISSTADNADHLCVYIHTYMHACTQCGRPVCIHTYILTCTQCGPPRQPQTMQTIYNGCKTSIHTIFNA